METLGKAEDQILNIMDRKRPSNKTAEGVALYRLGESIKPEGERICYDPYAIYFINPEILEFVRNNPDKAKADAERYEKLLPGMVNSGLARVRYFDDFVKNSVDEGLEQLVILGAGYDTRAYRIEGLKKLKVFEVDQPDTQSVKTDTVIFFLIPFQITLYTSP